MAPAAPTDTSLAGLLARIEALEAENGALLASEARLRAILDAEPECVKCVGSDGALLSMNPAGLRLIEADSFEQVAGANVFSLVAEGHRAAFESMTRDVCGGATRILEFELVGLKGSRRTMETHARPFRLGQHHPTAMLGITRDITERKRAEAALRESEERLRQLNRTYSVLSDINQLIVRERDLDRVLMTACEIATRQGGFLLAFVGLMSPNNTLQLKAHSSASPLADSFADDACDEDSWVCAFTRQALQTGEPAVCNDLEAEARVGDGTTELLERGYRAMASLPLMVNEQLRGVLNLYAGEAHFFDDDEQRLLVELSRDIAHALEMDERERERRTAVEELRAREERFRLLIENAHDIISVVDYEGKLRFASPSAKQILGEGPATQLGGDMSALIHPDDRAQADAAMASVIANPGQATKAELRVRRANGQWCLLESIGRSLPDQAPGGFIVLNSRDLTERRRLEEQLRQSQKMDAVGQLAGGVAHDFNNILTAILVEAELGAEVQGVPESVRRALAEIAGSAQRGAELTQQLLAFSRKQVMRPRELDVNDVVAKLTQMLQRLIGATIALELRLAPGALWAKADQGMLEQVVLNLALNARDAMPRGGTLIIETRACEVSAGEHGSDAESRPGPHACVRVTDTGEGIPPELFGRIFEPFFTTKAPGKGTGLGLATVFGIAKQHQGWVRVQSERGHGAAFEVYLPLLTAAPVKDSAAPGAARPPRGHETILLAEDDPSVRRTTKSLLERHGYRVLEAADGAQALELWERHRAAIALVLTDLVMPGEWSGQRLAARLRQERAHLRVIFFSGYSADIAGRELALEPSERFIAKPFRPEELVGAVRESLDARPE